MFLLVRRQHQALHTEFCLARCRRMYNIFHPYDPVAYRYRQTPIYNHKVHFPSHPPSRAFPSSPCLSASLNVRVRLEPFINASSYDADADLLPTWQGKYRVHYQVTTPLHPPLPTQKSLPLSPRLPTIGYCLSPLPL